MASDNRNSSPKRPAGNNNNPQEPRNSGGNFLGRSWFWLVLAVLVLFGSRFLFSRPTDTSNMIGLNEVANYVQNNQVSSITVQGDIITLELTGTGSNSEEKRSRKENDESLLDTLKALGVSEDRLRLCRLWWKTRPITMRFLIG